ncbi:MAG: hypothetical protein A2W90_15335 [Bacteroidetes bacterium GWF2_42_66]|nr:MAG: hypothetical protein A2W89_19830 [Bacteroidetes bacterium GWE2_42_39]OFY46863.1 MAG: hypothetical protein A2W90_15335 [Bacteroidetes bacterium GWF2_42_66]HBL75093.1 SusC/RagA family TonB-linked outer membrane protein [Prolixibacteraceae bacterium]HCU60234.1 SusC/RagA family TonB-linked outer membrane protein [Prolixibacteraceae bacterium]
MKKLWLYHDDKSLVFVIFKKMKLTVLLLCISVLGSWAVESYSQTTRLTVNFENTSIKQILNQIEEQSEYRFFYSGDVDVDKKASISKKEKVITEIMDDLFLGTDVKYRLMGRQIALFVDESENSMLSSGQQKTISGKVTNSLGEPIPGTTVAVKGTTTGTITDFDGKYSLANVSGDAVLVFSFVGMKSQEVSVLGKSTVNVMLVEETIGVDEVVVTALGIGKQKRSLSYATEQVRMDAVNTVKSVNLGESLAGKIAGVQITSSSGTTGVGGDTRIIIRGDRSIARNNQPLIVVDGVPYSNSGGGLSSINSDDVESINVLKGPSAAALYGSSANNGVIVITTKKGKAGTSQIEFNSVTSVDMPYLYPELQNEYAQGINGVYNAGSDMDSWGPRISGQTVTNWTGEDIKLTAQPDNFKDVFVTGYNATNSISYSAGNEKLTGYFSYSNTTAKGVVENNKINRDNFNMRLSSEVIKNLKIDFKMTYHYLRSENSPTTGDDMFSPMSQLIRMPRTIRTQDIEDYYYYDANFSKKQTTWVPGSTKVINPYWSIHARENPYNSSNMSSILTLRYDFTNWIYLQLRGNLNTYSYDSEEKLWWDTAFIRYGKGGYDTEFGRSRKKVGDVLLGIDKEINKDFRFGINLGAEINDSYGRSVFSSTGGDGLKTENKFSLVYGITPTTSDGEYRIQKQAVYGTGQLVYRNMLYLDVTARNDWSSTLPAPYRYFYPSIGLTGVVSDMFKLPEAISFAKVRASYAEVGNDASFAQIYQTFSAVASGPVGMIKLGSSKVATELIPEKTKSWEAGAELKFFENRFGLDFTYYKSNTFNQLLKVTTPSGTGYSSALINCGNIQNTGFELMLSGTPVKTGDFTWDIYGHFSKNDNKVIELAKTLKEYDLGTPKNVVGTVKVIEGQPYGEVYARGFEKDEQGRVVVATNGIPKVTAEPDADYLGNMNYDWRSGLTNTFTYRNWSLNFLIDLNYGGVRQSGTEANLLLYGNSESSLYGREGFIFDGVKEDGTKNDITITAQQYAVVIANRGSAAVGELFNHDATNSRLRELSVGYNFKFNRFVKDIRLSLVGRNLFFFYNGCKWFDPDVTSDPTINGQGGENSFLPYSRTLGFNLKVTL